MKLFKQMFAASEQQNSASNSSSDLLDLADKVLMPLFPPDEVVFDHGEGCYIYDTNDNKYLDFSAGIAVSALGHNHPAQVKALSEQASKIMHIDGYHTSACKILCAELLTKNSCFDQAFFCNSGTEAIEGAYKLIKKWAYDVKGPDVGEIISFKNAFHGRTMAAASMTNKRETQPFYEPYIGGVHFAKFNDITSVEALVNDKTAGIIIEPVQGEGGIMPADKEFLLKLRALCDEKQIALVFDEIQAGMGRLGTLFAYESFEVEPDIVTLAKGLGAGFPIGAVLAKQAFGNTFNSGAHGTTFGGNPLATHVASTVISEILSDGFLSHVGSTSAYLIEKLEKIKKDTGKIHEIRGRGLMIGIKTDMEGRALRPLMQANGLLTTPAGSNILRLTPPLIITKDHVDEAANIIEKTLKEI